MKIDAKIINNISKSNPTMSFKKLYTTTKWNLFQVGHLKNQLM